MSLVGGDELKYLKIGALLAFICIFISIILWDIHMVSTLTCGIGLIFLASSALLTGTFASGDRMRANYSTESAESRNQRFHNSICALLMAIPNFVVAILFYLLVD